jgi:excinuclease ABC subunit C
LPSSSESSNIQFVNLPPPVSLYSGGDILSFGEHKSPASGAVLLIHVAGGNPDIRIARNPVRFTERLLGTHTSGDQSRSAIVKVECWSTSSKLERLLLLYSVTRHFYPLDYKQRLRLAEPWFLALTLGEPWPRLDVSSKQRKSDFHVGPFSSRETAQGAADCVNALFHLRRCSDRWEPSPDHPGCVYGEIGQCLRPCQAAVDPGEYADECRRVSGFFEDRGIGTLFEVQAARDGAAEQLLFESAAQWHQRVEKVKLAQKSLESTIGPVSGFDGVAVTPGWTSTQYRLWPMRDGVWQLPSDIETHDQAVKALHFQEESFGTGGGEDEQSCRSDHLALYLRWQRSSIANECWVPWGGDNESMYAALARTINRLRRKQRLSQARSSPSSSFEKDTVIPKHL